MPLGDEEGGSSGRKRDKKKASSFRSGKMRMMESISEKKDEMDSDQGKVQGRWTKEEHKKFV